MLILGAGSDIARALARGFAARGHTIRLAVRKPEAIERDRRDLAVRYGVEATIHRYDATALDQVETFLDGLPETPQIVVSAVGLMGDQEANARDPARAALVITTNFTGPALMLEAVARRMAALGSDAVIIGLSSVAGDRGRAKNYIYGAAKAGFSEYLSGLRQKYSRSPLRVMTVKPGFVATKMTEGMDLPAPLVTTPEALAARVLRSFDRGRMVHYDLRWLAVMSVIKLVPERVFARMRF